MATIRDVAQRAGVSVATVSRVINNNGYVSEDTKDKVLKVMEILNYQPSMVARGLAGKRMKIIALILPDITNPFFAELARAVEDASRKYGYTVFLCNSDDQGDKEKSYIDVLTRKYIDGIIIASNTFGQDEINKLKKSAIPIVVLDRASVMDGCSVIRSTNYLGAQMAVEHLIDVGCTQVGHICGPQEFVTAKERLLGYKKVAEQFAWYTLTLTVGSDFTINGGKEAIKVLLQRHPKIDGVFAGNDLIAIGVLKQLHAMGIKVPEQIAVCGFDGIQITQITQPELTTIAQPIYDIGTLACKIIFDQIKGDPQATNIHELDVKLIIRASTGKELHT